jgi:hypothetical protein
MAGRWFSPGTPVSSTNKTDRHDITEILLKVALTIIKLILYIVFNILYCIYESFFLATNNNKKLKTLEK